MFPYSILREIAQRRTIGGDWAVFTSSTEANRPIEPEYL